MPRENENARTFSNADRSADNQLESADDQGGIEITDCQMKQILASLPEGVSAECQKRLQRDLREFATRTFPGMRLDEERRLTSAQRHQLKAVADTAKAFLKTLNAPDPRVQREIDIGVIDGSEPSAFSMRLDKATARQQRESDGTRALAGSKRDNSVSLLGLRMSRNTDPSRAVVTARREKGQSFNWPTRGSVRSGLPSSRSIYSVNFPYERFVVGVIGTKVFEIVASPTGFEPVLPP